jgi:hypothetical protein
MTSAKEKIGQDRGMPGWLELYNSPVFPNQKRFSRIVTAID